MYRLHIDIPLTTDEDESIRFVNELLKTIVNADSESCIFGDGFNSDEITINYRLGHDEDRQKSNYMQKNENGHVNNKKSSLTLVQ